MSYRITAVESPIPLRAATLIVDTDADAVFAREKLNLKAMPVGELLLGLEGVAGGHLVIASTEGASKTIDALRAQGVGLEMLRQVDLSNHGALSDIHARDVGMLRELLTEGQKPALHHIVRRSSDMPVAPDAEYIDIPGSDFSRFVRFRFPELCVVLGGYGQGKSQLAHILALQAITSPSGKERRLEYSHCAFEDELEDSLDLLWNFATEGQCNEPNNDNRLAVELEQRRHHFNISGACQLRAPDCRRRSHDHRALQAGERWPARCRRPAEKILW